VESNLLIIARDRDDSALADPLPVAVTVRSGQGGFTLAVRPVDPDLTATAEQWLRECMRSHGIELDRIEMDVTPLRQYVITGIVETPTRDLDAPHIGDELTECENQMMRELDLDPRTH
jgi:hypothetical protein